MKAGSEPDRRRRRSMRLRGYDYAGLGAYFVTICSRNRVLLFGDISNGEMRLSGFGKRAKAVWEEIPAHFPSVELDAFVVMPNHVHGIIVIPCPTPRATRASPLRGTSGRRFLCRG